MSDVHPDVTAALVEAARSIKNAEAMVCEIFECERDEELDDVLTFVHRLMCDALLRGDSAMEAAFDTLQTRLKNLEHRS